MIKTYDGAELVKQRIAKYPEGSLSPREVMLTIPANGNDNELAFKINSAITAAIYRSADAYIKANPVEPKHSFKMLPLVDIKVKVDDRAQRAAELSATVMKALELANEEYNRYKGKSPKCY